MIRALVQESAWVAKHENIFVLGPTGVGKSFVAWHWPRRRAAMATRRCTTARKRCFVIWRWPAPMEAFAICWPGWPHRRSGD